MDGTLLENRIANAIADCEKTKYHLVPLLGMLFPHMLRDAEWQTLERAVYDAWLSSLSAHQSIDAVRKAMAEVRKAKA